MIGPYELNQIYTGDARALAEGIPDNSVDLIFTDPVYWQLDDFEWLAETAARILKPRKSLLAFTGNAHFVEAGARMLGKGLLPGPPLNNELFGPIARMFSHSSQCNSMPLLWFSKDVPDNDWMRLKIEANFQGERGHQWGKNLPMITYRIPKFTQPDDIILDPFCGGGTIPAACKMLGRNYLAFEIDPATAEKARERVFNTQPPLFVPQPEQLELTP